MTKPKVTVSSNNKKKKANIPKALREQVWLQNIGNHFEHKCLVAWCQNTMNVFDYHVGHNIPESQGGATNIKNLKPICARCNLSMGSQYTIEEWSKLGQNLSQKTIKNNPRVVSVTETIVQSVKKPWWICC